MTILKVSGTFDLTSYLWWSWTDAVINMTTRRPRLHHHLYTMWRLCWKWSGICDMLGKVPQGLSKTVQYTCLELSRKKLRTPPIYLWWSKIDTLIYMSVKCPWLHPSGQGLPHKPHTILIIIMLCIDSLVRQLF